MREKTERQMREKDREIREKDRNAKSSNEDKGLIVITPMLARVSHATSLKLTRFINLG